MKSNPLGFVRTKLSQFINDGVFFTKDTTQLTNYYTKDKTFSIAQLTEKLKAKLKLGDYATPDDIKTNTAGYNNDTQFITALEDNLTHFFTIDNSMTKTQVKDELEKITKGIKIVPANSISDVKHVRTLYLIPSKGDENDFYDEYMFINNKAELIGNTKVNLDEYALMSEVESAGYVVLENLKLIATSAKYTDLTDLPTIPAESKDFTNTEDLVRDADLSLLVDEKSNQKIMRVENYEIFNGYRDPQWVEDLNAPEAANGFKYRAEIYVPGISGADWKVTDFFTMEIFNGTLGSIVETEDGKVIIWSNTQFDHTITIDSMDIMCVADTYDENMFVQPIKLGTLCISGKDIKMPTQPYENGNIDDILRDYNYRDIQIFNTVGGYELQWIPINDNGKQYLVCDRNILLADWDILNKNGLVEGKEFIIDGKTYKCRLMTGGAEGISNDNSLDGYDRYLAKDQNNEWDKIIGNDTYNILQGRNSNDIWHWKDISTICKEKIITDSQSNYTNCPRRGYYSSSLWLDDKTGSAGGGGFRPILELLDKPAPEQPTTKIATMMRSYDNYRYPNNVPNGLPGTFNYILRQLNPTKLTFSNNAIPQDKIATATLVSDSLSKEKIYLYNTTSSEYVVAPENEGVTIMANPNCLGMFSGLTNLTNLDLGNFDTRNVIFMQVMFNSCQSLTTLNFGNYFNTSKVTDMNNMFVGCESLTNLDLSNFDTSQVIAMYAMFSGCTKLTNITYGEKFVINDGCSTNRMYGDSTEPETQCPANRHPSYVEK